MHDHNYIDETGKLTPVSQMSIKDILDILHDGEIEIDEIDGYHEHRNNILERLRIELVIRSLPCV